MNDPLETFPALYHKALEHEAHRLDMSRASVTDTTKSDASSCRVHAEVLRGVLEMQGQIGFKKLAAGATLPTRGSAFAAGLDLCALEPGRVASNRVITVRTGIAISLPAGFYARIEGRSGLAHRNGLDVIGGIIDQDYTGEIHVILSNNGQEQFRFYAGERIAQLIVSPMVLPKPVWVEELPETGRGASGLGSTGDK